MTNYGEKFYSLDLADRQRQQLIRNDAIIEWWHLLHRLCSIGYNILVAPPAGEVCDRGMDIGDGSEMF